MLKNKKPILLPTSLLQLALAGLGVLSLASCDLEETAQQQQQQYTLEPPVVSPVQPDNLPSLPSLGPCPYSVQNARDRLLKSSKTVIDHWSGNVWLNVELAESITIAEKIMEDPRCSDEGNVQQLPQTITFSKQALNIGQSRLEETINTATDLLRSSP